MKTLKLNHDVLNKIKQDNKLHTDKALADAIGISPALMNQIKSGRRGVSSLFITGMLTELNVPFTLERGSLYTLEDASA